MIPRYSRPEMADIWSPETRFQIWFEIEAHACDAMAELGVIVGPGIFYGTAGEGFIRVALTAPDERIRAAAQRLEN